MKIALLYFLFIIGLGFQSFSQSDRLLDSLELESADVFYSVKEAMVNPDAVYRLHLKGKGLSDIPESVFKLKNLQELILTRNRFTEIPSSVSKLEKLQRLGFSKNHLKYINAEVAKLKNLRWLIASQNELVELPKELATLENLQVLDVWSNELEVVPPEYKQFKNLKKVDMRVILLSESKQEAIRKNFPPSVDVMFSPGCNCGN